LIVNKLVIVGHPSTAYDTFAEQLAQHGFKPARPSKREGLSPAEITATLCQTHRIPAQQPYPHPETPVAPLNIGAVWHGLALDLLLGNLEQPAWYWADPRTVYVLDYWRVADPELGFVLLYDDPAQALLLDATDPPPSPQVVLDHWVAYHRVLLAFYHHHRQHCVLLHARQACQVADQHWQQLQSLLDIPPCGTAPQSADQPAVTRRHEPTLPPLAETLAHLGNASDEPLDVLLGRAIEAYLSADLLAAHVASAQLYEELQATANVPWDGGRSERPEAAQVWQSLLQQRRQLNTLFSQLIDEKDSLNQQLQQAKDASAKAQAELKAQLEQQTHSLKGQQEENELLLLQLHQVQEELEQNFLETQKLKQETASNAKAQAVLTKQLQQEKDAGAKAQAELKSQLEQHQTHNIKELEEENELLLLQLHQVQEELERYFLENQQLKSGKTTTAPAPQVPQSAPAPKAYYGAAERIKRQLTYRLGAIMVSHSRKPADWLRMPGALLREAQQFKREAPEREAQKLPPIHTYADAYEAERVKRHLSYRLGVVLMEHSRSPKGWLTMPWAMRKAVREFRADRQ
jgi:hypothetical protein